MAIRMTGLNSGLDTESIIRELMTAHSTKKVRMQKDQVTLQWKQEAWKTMNSKINTFYNSTLEKIKFTTDYNKKVTSVNDPSLATVETLNNAVLGSQTLAVKQLAAAGYLTGGKLSGDVKGNTKLSDMGISEGSFNITTDGKTREVKIDANTSINSIVIEFKEAGLDASFDEKNQRFFISAKKSGEANDFSITANDNGGFAALEKMKLLTKESIVGNPEYKKWADYQGDVTTPLLSESEIRAQTIANLNAANKISDELAIRIKDLEAANKQMQTDRQMLVPAGEQLKEKQAAFIETQPYKDALAYGNSLVVGESATETNRIESITKQISDDKFMVNYDPDAENTQADMDRYDGLKSETMTHEEREARIKTATGHLENLNVQKKFGEAITENAEQIALIDSETIKNNRLIAGDTAIEGSGKTLTQQVEDDLVDKVVTAVDAIKRAETFAGDPATAAMLVEGRDGKILLNGAEFTSSSSNFNINGLIITASQISKKDESGKYITTNINTANDVDAMYDIVQDFIKDYSVLMNEMEKVLNVDKAKGYEPLTEEEKESLSEKEVENWEKKLKDTSLRNDDILSGVVSSMQEIMRSGIEVDGEMMYLADFGINTQSFFDAPDNQKNAYHIDGDADNDVSAGNSDRLRSMLVSDPDKVSGFFSQMVQRLHTKLFETMSADYTLSSAFSVYNDKKMEKDYSDYTTKIREEEKRLADLEDKYYAEFAAMETALSKINSSSSALSGLMG